MKLFPSKSKSALVLLLFAACILLPGCKSRKVIAPDAPGHPHVDCINVGKVSKMQEMIVEEATTWLGTPYVYAKAEKGSGTDCSGMVMKVYETVANRKLPRNSARQAEFCVPLAAEEVNTGDLVFFATGKDPEKVSHVGIMMDNENFIHASSSKGVVISKMTSDYYRRHFRMFGRVPDNSEDRAER